VSLEYLCMCEVRNLLDLSGILCLLWLLGYNTPMNYEKDLNKVSGIT
jgi:hypothetical protein